MSGRKPQVRKEGGVATEAAPPSLSSGIAKSVALIAAIVAVCVLFVLGTVRCTAGTRSVEGGGASGQAQEEREGVRTALSQYDADGDGLVDRTYGIEELDAAASPEGGGWYVGTASAYSLEDNTGGDATASGIPLDETSLTVAVSESAAGLLGSTVEIFYGGISVTAMVTDTGSFEEYGRVFDLAPAVWRAFGADSVDEWGVRDVSYRFVAQEGEG